MSRIRKKDRRRHRRRFVIPRSEEQFRALPVRSQEVWNRSEHVLTSMRAGASLAQGSRDVGIDPRTVLKLAGSALRKGPGGKYNATKADRRLYMLVMPTNRGVAEIAIKGSRDASVMGEYWNAVHLFLETGDSSALDRFEGRTVTNARGERVTLLTNLDDLERLGSAGILSFESLYARVA